MIIEKYIVPRYKMRKGRGTRLTGELMIMKTGKIREEKFANEDVGSINKEESDAKRNIS